MPKVIFTQNTRHGASGEMAYIDETSPVERATSLPMLTWADWELLQALHKERPAAKAAPFQETVKTKPPAKELAKTPLQLDGETVRIQRGSLRPVHRYDDVDTEVTVEMVHRLMDEVIAAENSVHAALPAEPAPEARAVTADEHLLRQLLKNAAAERDRALVQVTVYRKAYYNLLQALSAGPSLQAMLDAVRIIDAAVKDHENQ